MDKIQSVKKSQNTIERFENFFSRNSWVYVVLISLVAIISIIFGINEFYNKK